MDETAGAPTDDDPWNDRASAPTLGPATRLRLGCQLQRLLDPERLDAPSARIAELLKALEKRETVEPSRAIEETAS